MGLVCALLLWGGMPARAAAQAGIVACDPPALQDGETALLRCRREGDPQGNPSWSQGEGPSERRCPAVPTGRRLPVRPGLHCGTNGEEVWLWRTVEPVVRGSLRYLSWRKGDVWRLQAGDLLPDRLSHQGAAVTAIRWTDGWPPDAQPMAAARSRSWLGGAVETSLEGGVLMVEMGGQDLRARLFAELERLAGAGWSSPLREVEIVTALRPGAASGRSDPGRVVVEVGSAAPAERVLEVFRHEVAHQLIGGRVRLLEAGVDADWFLEGFAEYLGFAVVRDGAEGRAAVFRRFAEACGELERPGVPTPYDLGFLYAAATDGALWRDAGTSLHARLNAMAAEGTTVFGERSDFGGTDSRRSFFDELLNGITGAARLRLEHWMRDREQPDISKLGEELGLTLRSESVAWVSVPLVMRERRDGLFEVHEVFTGYRGHPVGVAPGDEVWPLDQLSGPKAPREVAIEVRRAGGWQRIRIPTVRGQQRRWRVVAADGVAARWFPAAAGQGSEGAQ